MVQAIGTAAAMAVELKKEIRPLHIQDLHEKLLKQGASFEKES